MFSCTLHGEVNMAARNELLLKRKVEVIEYANKNPSQSSRKIVEVFNCGHMQIQISSRKRRRFWVNMKPMRQHLWEQTISHIQLQVHIHHMCAQLNSTSRNCHLHQGNMCFQIGNATDKSMNISRHYHAVHADFKKPSHLAIYPSLIPTTWDHRKFNGSNAFCRSYRHI